MICVTFDTDHMSPAALATFAAVYLNEMPGRATFFAHQPFPELLETDHEVCPHPFISDLDNWEKALDRLERNLGRQAEGVRTHSCVFSHMVGVALKARGYRWISQAHTLGASNLAPFRHPWGVWELPIYYMDNMDFWMPANWPALAYRAFDHGIIERAVSGDALFVFDIHPVHVALNTRSPEDYAAVKDRVVREGVSPFELTFPGYGVRSFFSDLCRRMRETGRTSVTCSEALREYEIP